MVRQKRKKFLKPHSRRVFIFLFKKKLILTGKKHCGESRRCRNASAGPVQGYDLMGFYWKKFKSTLCCINKNIWFSEFLINCKEKVYLVVCYNKCVFAACFHLNAEKNCNKRTKERKTKTARPIKINFSFWFWVLVLEGKPLSIFSKKKRKKDIYH